MIFDFETQIYELKVGKLLFYVSFLLTITQMIFNRLNRFFSIF